MQRHGEVTDYSATSDINAWGNPRRRGLLKRCDPAEFARARLEMLLDQKPLSRSIREAVRPPKGFASHLGRGNPPAVLDSPRRRKRCDLGTLLT